MKNSIKAGGSDKKVLAIVTVDIMAWVLLRPWLEGLQDAGFKVHIACAKGQYYDQLGACGFIMHPVSFRRTFNVFAHVVPFFELIAILRAGRFQIVNTHSPVAAAVGRMAAAFAPVENIIYTVHGFYFHDRMPKLLASPIIALEWFLGRWTDAFMFVSDEDRRTAQRLGICGVHARVCTIYNGVDVDIYRPAADSDVVRDRPVVGVVGRIVKEKGYREFLEMARAITESGIDATYLVVGDSLPSDRDQFGPTFRALVKESGLADRFVFTGMTDRVPDYLRLMDIFVLPSYREGFPKSILEAMSTSLPVVATDIRGCREAVVQGVTGYIVPARDAGALRKAVEPLLTNPELRREMGREARRIAQEKYDFNEVRRRFVGFVEAVHDGGSPERQAEAWRQGGSLGPTKHFMYRGIFKPLADRLCAGVALAVTLPFLALLAVAIRSRMGRPVLFRQTRIGEREAPFIFFKFRTMTQDRDAHGNLLPDERRLTAFGKFLRSSSLDEIPQLWNVMKGEMSLVGPRPLLPEYVPLYSQFQRQRHKVKPGITGLAQVTGRNSISWERKFELDVYYVEHCSLGLDLKILWMTVASVMGRKGISQQGHATALPFTGSPR
jgi:lipopolysaccharide/colanic/teichoic acid biosynthesis glycosyltransferase/glycosyltransferase involved in cell wall biosynthesis